VNNNGQNPSKPIGDTTKTTEVEVAQQPEVVQEEPEVAQQPEVVQEEPEVVQEEIVIVRHIPATTISKEPLPKTIREESLSVALEDKTVSSTCCFPFCGVNNSQGR
jgi:hypothetical protein